MNKTKKRKVTLSEAPEEIRLAVDLIQLLEENQVDINVAVEALQIVLDDFKNKQAT